MLAIASDSVLDTLLTLQSHALEKLATRLQFQKTGVATLRIKVVGMVASERNILIQLNKTGEILKQEIILQSGMDLLTRFVTLQEASSNFHNYTCNKCSRLKLICNGLVLNWYETLEAQRVANNSLILVIVLSNDPESQKVIAKNLYLSYFFKHG